MVKRKWFLYLTSFFSGLSIMAVEIAASRLLSPYFSSSQIIWTMIIGTIMIAMAVGNIWGGKSADKNPNPSKLYLRLIIAAAWIALIPLVGKYIIAGVSLILAAIISGNYLIWSSLICCLLIFFVPLMLLGTTTPSLTRYFVQNVEESGKVVGRLGALNTIGSIIGTFLPTFVTIPYTGTNITFIIFASILLALGVTYFIMKIIDDHQDKKKPVVKEIVSSSIGTTLAIIFMISSAFTSKQLAFWDTNIEYEGESIYNYLRVYKEGNTTILSTNVLIGMQSIKYETIGFYGGYYDVAVIAPMFVPHYDTLDVLMLGLGTGTYSEYLYHYYPNVNIDIDGVEIDQKIVNLAYKYFALDERVNVYVDDGRSYLEYGKGKDKTYDIIFVDAYQDISIPFAMSSKEFMGVIKNHLKEDGMMMLNMNMRSDKPGSINEYLIDTSATAFNHIYTITAGSSNRLLFASNNDEVEELVTNQIELLPSGELKTQLNNISNRIVKPPIGNHVLTDDKAPVEVLSMQVLDDIIIDELSIVKEGIKEKGFFGFLRDFL